MAKKFDSAATAPAAPSEGEPMDFASALEGAPAEMAAPVEGEGDGELDAEQADIATKLGFDGPKGALLKRFVETVLG